MPILELAKLLVVLQRTPPTKPDLDEAARRVDALHAAGRPFGLMVLVDERMPMLDGATRTLLTDFIRYVGPLAGRLSVVLPGKGFWSAAMRGIATTFSMASKADIQVFSTAREALAAIPSNISAPSPSQLAAALSEHGLGVD